MFCFAAVNLIGLIICWIQHLLRGEEEEEEEKHELSGLHSDIKIDK